MGRKVFDTVQGFLLEAGVPGFIVDPTAGIATALVMLVPALIAALVQGVLGLGTFFAVNVLELIGKVRTENAKDFNQVIAAAMSEMLGVEISADDLPSGQGPQAVLARVTVIGSKLHDLLIKEFAPTGVVTPESGQAGARAFTGFGINFAVATAFIAILSESVTFGVLKEFRELGEGLAQSLGLGRLQRLALQPLIRNTIQQPYDLYLRKQYRPDRLTEQQYIRAMHAGAFDEGYVRDQMAQKGYPDAEIDRLMIELATRLTETELARLVRWGDITSDEAAKELNVQGVPLVTAQRRLRAIDLERADSLISQYVNVLEKQVFKGQLDLDGFNKVLDELPWSQAEKDMEKLYVSATLETPIHLLTLAQVKTGIIQGILDFSYFDQWAEDQGYGQTEALVLEYEILLALDAAATKEQAAAAQAARKTTRTSVVPPTPTPGTAQ